MANVFFLQIDDYDEGTDINIGAFSSLQKALDAIPGAFMNDGGATDEEKDRSFVTEYEVDVGEVAMYNGHGVKQGE